MELNKIMLNKAMAMLNAARCSYAIVTDDGQEFGDLKIARDDGNTRRHRENRGISEYIKGCVRDVPIGGTCVIIPTDKFPLQALRSSVPSTLGRIWGLGSFCTHKTDECVEVARLS